MSTARWTAHSRVPRWLRLSSLRSLSVTLASTVLAAGIASVAVIAGSSATPAGATTVPGRMCSGQEVAGSSSGASDDAWYNMDIPSGATYTVTGSVDILASAGGVVGWQTIFHVDPGNFTNLGSYWPGPYYNQGFGPWNRTQNTNPDGRVPVHIYQDTKAATQIRWRVTITITSGNASAGVCTPMAPKETTGDACAIKNAAGSQGSTGDPVNTATGNFNESFADLAVAGRGPSLALKHAYNSLQAAEDGPLGFGWTHSYAASLSLPPGPPPSDPHTVAATVHQETGSEVYFYSNGTGGFEAPVRQVATLVRNPDGTYTFRRCNALTMGFSATGQLTFIADRNGYTTTLAYASGKLSTVTDPANRKFHFTWTGSHVTSVSDDSTPARTVSFVYDGAGNLTDHTDVGGGSWHFGYDGAHHLTTMRRPRQAGVANPPLTTNVYDAGGRVTSQTDELNRTILIDYTSIPGATKITDPKGNVTVETYSNLVRTAVTRGYGTPAAATWSIVSDPYTLGITKVTDPNNHVTTAAYDRNGNMVSRTDALGHTTRASYNAFDQPLTATDANGVTTTYTYDAAGNLKTVSTPLLAANGAVVATRTTAYAYDPARPGDLISITDPSNKVWTQGFDGFGHLVSTSDPLGNITRYGYDTAKGWVTSTLSPRGVAAGVSLPCTPPAMGCSTFAHDAWGRVTVTTDANGHHSTAHYDGDGNLDYAIDADNNRTDYIYDAANQRTTVARADATATRTDYWPDGNIHRTYDGADKATVYAYDAQGRLTAVTDPNNRTTTYGYDPAGNLVSKADPGGTCPPWPITYPPALATSAKCTVMRYDNADRLMSVAYSDGQTPNVSYGYDNAGRRTTMADGTGSSSWSWDSLNRLTATTDGAAHAVGYAYANLRDPATTLTYAPGKAVTRAFDAAGRMTSTTDWLNNTTTFSPDPDSNVATVTFPAASGLVDSYGFDNAGQLMSVTSKSGGATRSSLTYGRDNAGQVSSVASTGAPSDVHSYTYTPLNQLKNDGAPANYGYDNADNLRATPAGWTLNHDDANQLTTVVNPADTTTMAYDTRGNRTSAAPDIGVGTTLAYDQANRLSVFDPKAFPGSLAGGWYHSLGVKANGTVWAWGQNDYGQLGNGTLDNASTPQQVPGLAGVVAVAGGALHSVALKADGTVWTWGWNNVGQLGNGNQTDSRVPVPVQGLSDVVAISAGAAHIMALRRDGTVWAWGFNSNGQLGDGTTTNRSTPMAVPGLSGVTAVAAGYSSSVALRGDGTVWTWGSNDFGQLGNNSITDAHAPAQVPGLSAVGSIAAGWFHVLALRSDGTVSAWGYNNGGQLGIGSSTDSHLPVPVPGLSGVTAVSASCYQSFALKGDAVWSWGWNAYGQLGDGTINGAYVPVNIGLSGITSVSAGALFTLAQRGDGTVASWGYNASGSLGNGSTNEAHSPGSVSSYNRGATPRAAYAYNGDGLRASKTVSGTTASFTWDNGGGVPLLLDDGTNSYIYGPDGLPVEHIDRNGVATWYHHDQLGSTRSLTNGAGAVVATATYDPYGGMTASAGRLSPLGFAGEYTDAETGFVYLRARYYDPGTGQFITRDPLTAMTGSAYAYVDGNPLNYTDPMGLIKWGKVFSGRNLKIAALGLGVAALAVATAGTAPAVLAVVSAHTLAYVSTGLAVASTAASAGVAYQDCSNAWDKNCYASLAELAGGAVSAGVSAVAGRIGRPLIAIASGGLGAVFDLLAFATPRGEATAWISHGHGRAVQC